MKLKKRLILLAALAVLLCGCGKTEQYMEQGIALLKEEKYVEAAAAFENALAKRTDYTATEEEDILLYYGEANYKAGDYKEAIQTYKKLIACGKEEKEVYRFLGAAQYEAGNYEEAMESFLKAVAMGDVSAYGEVAKVQMALGKYEEAENNYQIMLEEEPENPKWMLALGQCKLTAQNYQEALIYFEQGVTIPCENGQIKQALLYHQAICYEYLGDFATARNLFATYVAQYPDDAQAQKEYEFLLSR